MGWEDDWAPDHFLPKMMEYRGTPTWEIPPFISNSMKRRNSGTTMPAGPLVEKYSITMTMESNASEFGHPAGRVRGTIKWLPVAEELRAKRDILLGDARQEIDEYHSQIAACPTWTMLNQMQKKIDRTRTQIEYVEDRAMRKDRAWSEAWRAMNQNALDAFSWDSEHVDNYVKEHATSAVIPPTLDYGSVKWSELNTDQLKYLYESAKSYLEYKMDHWDEMLRMQWRPTALGLGTRARGPSMTDFAETFDEVIDQAREIGYNPYLSTWYAWQPGDSSKKIYDPMIEISEDRYGVEIAFPPLLGGSYWQKIAEYIEQGHKIVNGDGTNWDSWVTILINDYSTSAEKGVPGLISGQSMTSAAGTFANHMLTEEHIDTDQVEAIFALGDDKLVVLKIGAPETAVREIPNVWEFDPVGTRHVIALGLVILDDRRGTFSGMYRGTIDRGDARIRLNLGKEKKDIGSPMTDENREVYLEIMGEGTLQGIPFIDRIATIDDEEFWEGWRRERYSYLGGLSQQFEVLIQDDYFSL